MRAPTLARASMQSRWSRVLPVTIACVLFSATTTNAASLYLTSNPDPSSGLLVGEGIQLDLHLSTTSSEGPGDASISIEWGGDRPTPYWLGALSLFSLPSALDSSISLSLGADCGTSLGQIEGSCGITATFSQPVAAGTVDIATFVLLYNWVPEPGFELCDPVIAGCQDAGQWATLRTSDPQAFGVASPALPNLYYQTFGEPQVRPIPEPGTALLLGLGLAGLASDLRRRGSS